MSLSRKTVVYIFRNDLRLHDNECLEKIATNVVADYLIPVYCFDPDHFKGTWHHGFPKTGPHRAKFLLESVTDLKQRLRQKNSDLFVSLESPFNTFKTIVEQCRAHAPVTTLVYQKEVTFEEVKVEVGLKQLCSQYNVQVEEVWGSTLHHIKDIPFKIAQIPDAYTQFRKEVEGRSRIRNTFAPPEILKPWPGDFLPQRELPKLSDLGIQEPSQDVRSAFRFKGGETTALERLDYYLWQSDLVSTYKQTRNGLLGESYSTKFSPWLSNGSLSPRLIYRELKRYEKERVSNESTYWVIFELLWRDYFRFVCLKFGDRVFYRSGILGRDQAWKVDMKLFDSWAQGRTGVPFVDANMRELKETGWMSNRGRQNVASFLVKDLGLDWRLGAEWFESYLLDHDVCSNYGNWNYAAGVGNDPRENRKFNMIKQAGDYDPDGLFVKTWCPELKSVHPVKVHVPWVMSNAELSAANIELGIDYPNPVIQPPPEWTRHTNKNRGGSTGKGQKGIDSYFKSGNREKQAQSSGGGRGSGRNTSGGEDGSSVGGGGGVGRGGAGSGNRGGAKKGAPRGGRVQF